MKKMNRKGFTLIELLVVIVILLVIMSIAIPSVTSSIERSKEKQRERQEELILSEAEIYVDNHKNSYPNPGTYCLPIGTLKNANNLTETEIKDSSSNSICGSIKITKNNSDYSYECKSSSDCS